LQRASLSWKRAKKEPKGQKRTKGPNEILRPASVIWDHISETWLQKGQPGNPGSHKLRWPYAGGFSRFRPAFGLLTIVLSKPEAGVVGDCVLVA